jgi:succinate dehydrogenase/fumarate reductase flavoprotein subunit
MKKKDEYEAGSLSLPWDEEHDLIVLGAGTSGLTAALVSVLENRRTLLIEKSDQIGGTSALSSGTMWIPGN